MLRYSVSLGYFFTDQPLHLRFPQARAAGFGAVEMFWPGVEDLELVAKARAASGIDVVLVNLNEGDYASGDRGFACQPERREWWRRQLGLALEFADVLGHRNINVLPGKVPPGRDRGPYLHCFVDNLRWAAPLASERGVKLLVEPLNHLTHPYQLCQRTADVIEVLDLVDDPNVALQYDIFHAQRSEGNIIETLRAHLDRIGHVQVADVPTRSAPGTGELNFGAIFDELETLGYDGYVGLEYQPPAAPADPFGWLAVDRRG